MTDTSNHKAVKELNKITKTSQIIFKEEWEKIKKGK